jgi:hypothetical protein
MDTTGEKEIPIDTFDALLRDLVTWDLVVPGEGDDAQAWQLVARAQQRLGELTIARGPWPAERTVYLDRLCADCRRRQLTWVRDGTYVCDPCWQKRLTRAQDEATSVTLAAARRPPGFIIIGNESPDELRALPRHSRGGALRGSRRGVASFLGRAGRQGYEPTSRRLDASGVDVAADEAPAYHDRRDRSRAGAEERVDNQLARLGDLAHPVPDWFEGLLPRVKRPLVRTASALGPGEVADPAARPVLPSREERDGLVATEDRAGVDPRVPPVEFEVAGVDGSKVARL